MQVIMYYVSSAAQFILCQTSDAFVIYVACCICENTSSSEQRQIRKDHVRAQTHSGKRRLLFPRIYSSLLLSTPTTSSERLDGILKIISPSKASLVEVSGVVEFVASSSPE